MYFRRGSRLQYAAYLTVQPFPLNSLRISHMARATQPLIKALRESASNLQQGARYEWGHVGRCNCGHLVQAVTRKSASEIYRSFDVQLDEWTEHAQEFCPTTNRSVEDILDELIAIGFERKDVRHLEYLSDDAVLQRLPEERRFLRRNAREDVVLYLSTMAEMLEEELVPG